MEASPQSGRAVKFGAFELDLAAGDLRKNGLKVRLQEQPFRLLALLVQRPGELVSREELREKLWPSDTYVDFDNSLNTAASKLRDALGDSASHPRFIETLPRRGYRFLASVEAVGGAGIAEGLSPAVGAGVAAGTARNVAEHADRRRKFRLSWGLLAVTAVGLAVVSVIYFGYSPSENALPPFRRFTVRLPVPVPTAVAGRPVAISPNGRYIAYLGAAPRKLRIYDLQRAESRAIESTEQAVSPFWSPDSTFIGFASQGELKKVAAEGGLPISIWSGPDVSPYASTWSPDLESIVFSPGALEDIYEVPTQGDDVTLLISREQIEGLLDEPVRYVHWPHFLPSKKGRRVLLFAVRYPTGSTLAVQDVTTGQLEWLVPGTKPFYSPSGHIVYQPPFATNEIWALPFSLDTLKATGETFPVSQNGSNPTVADDQTLVYLNTPQLGQRQLVWLDRRAVVIAEVGQLQENMIYPSLSPDERHVTISATQNSDRRVWIWDTARSVKTSLGGGLTSAWSPTGKELAFTSGTGQAFDIFRRRADGSGDQDVLAATANGEFLNDWSSDGNYLIYELGDSANAKDLWYLERDENSNEWTPHPFLETPSNELAAQFSPDGRFVAYVSNESGRNEVYVRPFPEGDGKTAVSSNGGRQPCWSGNGRELFYVEGETLVAVPVSTDKGFSVGAPQHLFAHPAFYSGSRFHQYDVTADGERFILAAPVEDEDAPTEIHVVQNWFAEFKDRPGGAQP